MNYARPTPRWDQIRALAEEAGPAGVTQADIRARMEIKAPVLWSALLDYVKRGWLFKVGRPTFMRYYLRKDWADQAPKPPTVEEVARAKSKRRDERRGPIRRAEAAARAEARAAAKAAKSAKPKPKKAKAPRLFDKRALPAPVEIKAPTLKQPAQIVTPPGVKVQRGPSYTHDPRFQLPPGAKVRNGFSALGIGRYLETA